MGLGVFALGLVGLTIKSNVQKDQKRSLTGTQIILGTYALLGSGVVLIILSFLSK